MSLRNYWNRNKHLAVLVCVFLLIVNMTFDYCKFSHHENSLVSGVDNDALSLWQCLQNPFSHTADSEACRKLRIYLDSGNTEPNKTVTTTPNNTKIKRHGCYMNLHVGSEKENPLKDFTVTDGKSYLRMFHACGIGTYLVSKETFLCQIDNLPIPNIVHYVWICSHKPCEINFLQYMSVFSASKYIKPCYIFWHGNYHPTGEYWEKLRKDVPNIYFVGWIVPHRMFGRKLSEVYFQSDILRYHILIVHGGIYLDSDTLVLKSFDPLRKYKTVLGRELRYTLANGIILAERWNLFLRMWIQGYEGFSTNNWSKYGMMLPNQMSRIYPLLVHIEERNLLYPTWPHVRKLYKETFDWSPNYSVHVFGKTRAWFAQYLPNNTHDMDVSQVTVGAIMRQIYYDDPKVRT